MSDIGVRSEFVDRLNFLDFLHKISNIQIRNHQQKGCQMNFEIVGKLLERTVSLASKLQCDVEDILSEIYRKGLEVMEGVKPAHAKRLPNAETASFIKENWSVMSDEEMAQELGLSFFGIIPKTRGMKSDFCSLVKL